MPREQLEALGLAHLGKNVKISDKASLNSPESLWMGDHARIDDFCVISGCVRLERNVHIANHVSLEGGTAGIHFDPFSAMAYHGVIFSQSDDYLGYALTNPTVPQDLVKVSYGKVHIGRHVLIGTSVVIMPGVTLGDGCSVGCMSLVTKSCEEGWKVLVGIPAKPVKDRRKDLLEKEAEYMRREQHSDC